MSASIMWRPTKGARSLGVGAPSSFIVSMENVFGSPPWRLGRRSIQLLRAMGATGGHAVDNPYLELAEIVERHDEIEIWAEY